MDPILLLIVSVTHNYYVVENYNDIVYLTEMFMISFLPKIITTTDA